MAERCSETFLTGFIPPASILNAEAAYEAGELAHAFMAMPEEFPDTPYRIAQCYLTKEKCAGHCDEALWVFDVVDITADHPSVYSPIRCGRPLRDGDIPHVHCNVSVSKTELTAGGVCQLTKCDQSNHCSVMVPSYFARRDWTYNGVPAENVLCGLLLPCAIHA